MNTLPDDIQVLLRYAHQLEYKHVMNLLKASFSYCGYCGEWMLTTQACADCRDEYWDEYDNDILYVNW